MKLKLLFLKYLLSIKQLYEFSSLTKQTVSDVEEWRRIRGEQDLAYEEALLIYEAKITIQFYKNVRKYQLWQEKAAAEAKENDRQREEVCWEMYILRGVNMKLNIIV